MGTSINALILEDSPSDAELILHELRRAGFDPHWTRVDTGERFAAELNPELDIILADYTLPEYDVLMALDTVKAMQLDVPLIVVTGAVDESRVVEALRRGASDYLVKDRLSRLGPAVNHALEYRALQQKQREAQAQIDRYQMLSDQARDIILFVRVSDGQILEANQAAVEAYGYTHEALLASTVFILRRPDEHDDLRRRLDQSDRAGAVYQTIHYRKDGRHFPVEISAHSATLDGERVLLSVIRDISDRVQTEDSLRAANERINAILASSPVAVVAIDREECVTTWTPAAELMFGWSAGEVIGHPCPLTSIDDAPDQLGGFCHGRSNESLSIPELRLRRKDGGAIDVSIRTAPLHDASDAVIGTLIILENITGVLQREQEREAIARVASALRTADRSTEMFPVILEQVETLLGVSSTAIGLFLPNSDLFSVELAHGEWIQWNTKIVERSSSPIWDSLHSGTSILVDGESLVEEPLFQPNNQIGSILAVPLIAQNDVIGVLCAGKNSPPRDQDLPLLKAVADISANAIHRALLYDQTVLAFQRLSILRTIDQAISASMDLRLVLDLLINQITTQLRMDIAMIYLYSPSVQTLEFAVGRGYPPGEFVRRSFRLGESRIGMVALKREMDYIPDLSMLDDEFGRRIRGFNDNLVTFIAIPLIAKGQVKGVMEIFHRSRIDPDLDWLDFLRALGAQTAIAIDNAEMFGQLQRSNTNLTLAYDATIEGWSRALDLRDEETEDHSQRVTNLTLKLATRFGIPPSEQIHIRRGALLHDIGKVGVPDTILNKTGPLTDEEWTVMRKHPEYAVKLLSPISYLQPAIVIPAFHHEKWDGSGYPHGLKGEEIPFAARIFAVVDVWDALISDRCYRPAWNHDKARSYICEQSGTHFDPKVVEAFLDILTNEDTMV